MHGRKLHSRDESVQPQGKTRQSHFTSEGKIAI